MFKYQRWWKNRNLSKRYWQYLTQQAPIVFQYFTVLLKRVTKNVNPSASVLTCNLLLGAFAKLRKATISFRIKQSCSHWTDLIKSDGFFLLITIWKEQSILINYWTIKTQFVIFLGNVCRETVHLLRRKPPNKSRETNEKGYCSSSEVPLITDRLLPNFHNFYRMSVEWQVCPFLKIPHIEFEKQLRRYTTLQVKCPYSLTSCYQTCTVCRECHYSHKCADSSKSLQLQVANTCQGKLLFKWSALGYWLIATNLASFVKNASRVTDVSFLKNPSMDAEKQLKSCIAFQSKSP